MKNLAAVVLAIAASAGCYGPGMYGSVGYSANVTAPGPGYVAYSTPPPEVVDVDLYAEERPGYVYINGRYNWINNQWLWQDGYYEVERPNQIYVQGYWNNGRWSDGYWSAPRAGYVYTGGYWDRRGRGHVWVPGTWETHRNDSVYVRGNWTNNRGVRSYNRGRWQRGPATRDHRR